VSQPIFIVIGLALFVGACGKSAQIPLYRLPDAMEGPTPVSALIHAATMVTAGVYMVARSNWIYQLAPEAGGRCCRWRAHRVVCGPIGLVQNDIKRVLAYLTVSHWGTCSCPRRCGLCLAVSPHDPRVLQGLVVPGLGSVIHAMHHEQDMRKMGAVEKFDHGVDNAHRNACHCGNLGTCGLLLKRRDSLAGVFSEHGHPVLWLIVAIAAG
jgi:NADH-quinone oxidoreductase subunit L